jgi:hypothetical protein
MDSQICQSLTRPGSGITENFISQRLAIGIQGGNSVRSEIILIYRERTYEKIYNIALHFSIYNQL